MNILTPAYLSGISEAELAFTKCCKTSGELAEYSTVISFLRSQTLDVSNSEHGCSVALLQRQKAEDGVRWRIRNSLLLYNEK